MADRPLGFEYQNDYGGACGAYALGHAMNLIGIPGEIEDSKKYSNYRSISGSVKKNLSFHSIIDPISTVQKIYSDIGTSERGIVSGIRKQSCTYTEIDNYSEQNSREILDSMLEKGIPVILFVNVDGSEEDKGHWLVCGGKTGDKYVIIDSSPVLASKGVISLHTWIELRRRFIFFEWSGVYFNMSGYAIQSPSQISAVPRIHNYLTQLYRNEGLREWWGYYLDDLLAVFDNTGNSGDVMTSESFFQNYTPVIIQNIRYWYDDFEKSRIEKELSNYKIVADVYDLAISKEKVPEAAISMTVAVIAACETE